MLSALMGDLSMRQWTIFLKHGDRGTYCLIRQVSPGRQCLYPCQILTINEAVERWYQNLPLHRQREFMSRTKVLYSCKDLGILTS